MNHDDTFAANAAAAAAELAGNSAGLEFELIPANRSHVPTTWGDATLAFADSQAVITLRLPRRVHHRAKLAAALANRSLNSYLLALLERVQTTPRSAVAAVEGSDDAET